jgi:hypothetical protein
METEGIKLSLTTHWTAAIFSFYILLALVITDVTMIEFSAVGWFSLLACTFMTHSIFKGIRGVG